MRCVWMEWRRVAFLTVLLMTYGPVDGILAQAGGGAAAKITFENGRSLREPLTGFICGRLTDNLRADPEPGTEFLEIDMRQGLPIEPFAEAPVTVSVAEGGDGNPDVLEIVSPVDHSLGKQFTGTLSEEATIRIMLVSTAEIGSGKIHVQIGAVAGQPGTDVLLDVQTFVLNPVYGFRDRGPFERPVKGSVSYRRLRPEIRDRFRGSSARFSLIIDIREKDSHERIGYHDAMEHEFSLHDIDFRNSIVAEIFKREGRLISVEFGMEQEVEEFQRSLSVSLAAPGGSQARDRFLRFDARHEFPAYGFTHNAIFTGEDTLVVPGQRDALRFSNVSFDIQRNTNVDDVIPSSPDPITIKRIDIPMSTEGSPTNIARRDYVAAFEWDLLALHGRATIFVIGSALCSYARPIPPF